jgi:signal transduction histidine kinase
MKIIASTVERLRRTNVWNILWVSLILSEILTALMNALLGYLWWGEVSLDLILIGTIDAFFVAGIVTVLIVLILREYERVEKAGEENLRRMGAMQEREDVSRWLHDDLGADFFNIILMTEILQQKDIGEREAREYLDWIADASRNALGNIRSYLNFSEQVGPAVNDLVGYIRDYGQVLLRKKEIEFDFQSAVSEKTAPLAPMKSFSVYLIYKEAITNILKHAGARKIEVRLVEYAGKLLLTIRDDGRGFSLEEASENRRGKKNISHRAEMIGGRISFDSEPGQGTSINLSVPV